jgi:hypothetical protein
MHLASPRVLDLALPHNLPEEQPAHPLQLRIPLQTHRQILGEPRDTIESPLPHMQLVSRL